MVKLPTRDQWKRWFPTLAEWDAGKWIALPAIAYVIFGWYVAGIWIIRFSE